MAPFLADLAARIPALQLTALCLVVATLGTWPAARVAWGRPQRRMPTRIAVAGPPLVLGAVGLYFVALRRAPAAEAALIAYSWPVLFVVAAELAAYRRVGAPALVGSLLAFGGAAILLAPGSVSGRPAWDGYLFAFASGSCWAAFSLLASRQREPLARTMPRLFAVAAVYAGLGHGLLETTLWSLPGELLLLVAAIGAGPYGFAFLLWDAALRRGPSTTVGTLAYAVPVLSTLLLIATGSAVADARLAVAAGAVVTGCAVASRRRLPRLRLPMPPTAWPGPVPAQRRPEATRAQDEPTDHPARPVFAR
jgi:drug/metabolite transporter (DMT)-like permease